MSRCLLRTALLVATVAFWTVSAGWADTVSGTTTGCFTSSSNGNATAVNSTPNTACGPGGSLATDAGLTFNGGTFSVVTDNTGFGAIGGGNNNLGTFTLSSQLAAYAGDTFVLYVDVADPASGVGNVPAILKGNVQAGPSGGVSINFTSPIDIALANGQDLMLTVTNPVTVFANSGPAAIGGTVQLNGSVPEPSAMLLIGSGLLSLTGIRRRWFQ